MAKAKFSKVLFYELYKEIEGNKRLFSFKEIIQRLPEIINENNIRPQLLSLERVGLVDLIFADKKGEPFVFISLTNDGLEYFNRKKKGRREFLIRILLALFSAIITFFAGRLLYRFF